MSKKYYLLCDFVQDTVFQINTVKGFNFAFNFCDFSIEDNSRACKFRILDIYQKDINFSKLLEGTSPGSSLYFNIKNLLK